MLLAIAGLFFLTGAVSAPPETLSSDGGSGGGGTTEPGWMIQWRSSGVCYGKTGTCLGGPDWAWQTASQGWSPGVWQPVGQSADILSFYGTGGSATQYDDTGPSPDGFGYVNGHMQAAFQWNPGSPTPAPSPSTLYVRVTAETCEQYPIGSGLGNMFNPLTTVSTEIDNTQPGMTPMANVSSIASQVYALTAGLGSTDPADAASFLTPNFSVWANATGYYPTNWCQATCSMTATPLPSPYITTAIDQVANYHKGADGSQVANARDADGNMTVDVAATEDPVMYTWGAMSGDPTIKQSIYSSPLYQWKATGFDAPTQCNNIDCPFTVTFPGQMTGSGALGLTTSLTCTVTDGTNPDNPAAPANYSYNWHYPYENCVSYGQTVNGSSRFPDILSSNPATTRSVTNYPGGFSQPGSCYVTFTKTNGYVYRVAKGTGLVLEVAAFWVKAVWVQAVLCAIGKTWDWLWDLTTDWEIITFENAWNDPESRWVGAPNDDSLKDDFVMTPVPRVIYTQTTYNAEIYGQSGFQGYDYYRVDDNPSKYGCGVFQYSASGGGGGAS